MNETLSKTELFNDLGEAGRATLEEFLEERTFQDGHLLFQHNQEASELLVIADGQVTLNKGKGEIASLGPGNCIGGLSLVVIGRRECDAVAAGPVQVLVLTRESYVRLRADYPGVAMDLQEALLREVGSTLRNILGDLTSTG